MANEEEYGTFKDYFDHYGEEALDSQKKDLERRMQTNADKRRVKNTRRKIAKVATAAILTAGLAVGVHKVGASEDDRNEYIRPSLAPTLEIPVEKPTPPQDEMATELQKGYKESKAKLFQEPFPIGLTVEEQQRLAALKEKKGNNDLTISDPGFAELAKLQMKKISLNDKVTISESLIKKYDASFIGATEVTSGTRFNFWQIKADQGRKVRIDPQAVDAYDGWLIKGLDNFYKDDPSSAQSDSDNLSRIAELQSHVNNGELTQPVTVLINPDDSECFSTGDMEKAKIVPEKNKSCRVLGFAQTNDNFSVVGMNARSALDTRATEKDPYNLNSEETHIWKSKQAINAIWIHELTHTYAQKAGLFADDGEDKDYPSFYNNEHRRLVHPVTNKFITEMEESANQSGVLPPLPFSIS